VRACEFDDDGDGHDVRLLLLFFFSLTPPRFGISLARVVEWSSKAVVFFENNHH